MYAYARDRTPDARRSQPAVPRPDRSEYTSEAIRPLTEALGAAGNSELAARVREHLEVWVVDRCPDGHASVIPSSDGCKLCPWDRRQKLERWVRSLLNRSGATTEGFVLEVSCRFTMREAKRALKGAVLGNRGAAALDFRPTHSGQWQLVVVGVGIEAPGLDDLLDAAQGLGSGGALVSIRRFPLNDVGGVLDQVMPRLRDFDGNSELLRQYLTANFGHQVISGRTRRKKNADSTADSTTGAGALQGPEEAAAAFEAWVHGQSEPSPTPAGGEAASLFWADNMTSPAVITAPLLEKVAGEPRKEGNQLFNTATTRIPRRRSSGITPMATRSNPIRPQRHTTRRATPRGRALCPKATPTRPKRGMSLRSRCWPRTASTPARHVVSAGSPPSAGYTSWRAGFCDA